MTSTEKRLGLALLFTAGTVIFNVYLVLTGAADYLYNHLPYSTPQYEVQAPLKDI